MKIVHNIDSLKKSNGGTTFFVSDLCQGLSKIGENISLISGLDSKSEKIDDLYLPPENEVNSILIGINNGSFLKNFLDKSYSKILINHLKEASIVHLTGLWTLASHRTIQITKKLNLPIIISPQGMLEPWALKNHFWKKKLARLMYQDNDLKSATVIHATAEQEAINIRNLGFNQPIAIIPNCINFDYFKLADLNVSSNVLSKPSIKTGIRKLLFLSRIHPKKGLMQFFLA